MATITIDTKIGYVTGRNGTFDVKKISVWEGSDGRCYIDFYSRIRGNLLNAGGCISLEAMDELAEKWLQMRKKEKEA